MKLSRVLILLIVLFLLALNADNSKKGFFVGAGIGISSIDLDGTQGQALALAIPFEIGYGFSEDFLLYYASQSSTDSSSDAIAILGISGIGASYYIKENIYLKAVIGASSIAIISQNTNSITINTINGLGTSVGFGYHTSFNSSIEFMYSIFEIKPIQGSIISMAYKYNWF